MDVACAGKPEFYTVSELQAMLKIGRNSVYRLVNSHGFPTVAVGNRIIVPKDKFLLWLDRNIQKGGSSDATAN